MKNEILFGRKGEPVFHRKSPYSEQQLIHDSRQITSREQLIVGQEYKHMTKYPDKDIFYLVYRFLVLSLPTGSSNIFRVKNLGYFRRNSYESDESLADLGIVPYEWGKWNALHWIMPTETCETWDVLLGENPLKSTC